MVINHPYGGISKGCGHALAPVVIEKDHGHLLIESALHSFGHQWEQAKPDSPGIQYLCVFGPDHRHRWLN